MIAAAAVAAGLLLVAQGAWTAREGEDGVAMLLFGLFLVAAGCVALA